MPEESETIKKVECATKIMPWLKKLKASAWAIALAPFLTLMGNVISPWVAYLAVIGCVIAGALVMRTADSAIKELQSKYSL